jgi:hypothetical protein
MESDDSASNEATQSPHTLDYAAPTPVENKDNYSNLVGGVMVWTIIMILFSVDLLWSPDCPRETAWICLGYLFLCLSGQIVVIMIRKRRPDIRKWPSLLLNVLLLTFIPIGTLAAIYGFFVPDIYTNGNKTGNKRGT